MRKLLTTLLRPFVCSLIASPGNTLEQLAFASELRWRGRRMRNVLEPVLPNGDPLAMENDEPTEVPPTLPDYPTDVPAPQPHDIPAWEPTDDPPPDSGDPEPKPRPTP